MRAAVVGFGAVGRRAAQVLAAGNRFGEVVVVHRDPDRVRSETLGWTEGRDKLVFRKSSATGGPPVDVTVVAVPAAERRVVESALQAGSHVVCATDDPSEVRAVLALDSLARHHGLSVAVGTVMAPGLSCVLAAHLHGQFDRVDEIHVASFGTGGPSCARRHHAALAGVAVDYEDGEWRRRSGGSGRELIWFPDPVGGADCYRASLADPFLLAPAFPGVRRITSRIEATRRDRLTSWLPMLRAPHAEGLLGAVRVELRGWVAGRAETKIIGAAVAPAVAAGVVSAVAAQWAVTDRLLGPGAAGLAGMVPFPGVFLRELALAGVRVSAFEGGYAPDS